MRGGEGNDRLSGGTGDDVVRGGKGDDQLYGYTGNDELRGGTGNDTLYGDKGDDRLFGHSGDDRLSAGSGHDLVHAGDGNDLVLAYTGNDTVKAGRGHDRVYGGDGDDILHGGKGDDQIWGEAGNDRLRGGQGNDRLSAGSGDDDVFGGKGDDTILGYTGADELRGGQGKDDIRGGSGDDTLFGHQGDDTLGGGSGQDVLKGGSGADLMSGEAGNDTLHGGKDGDVLYGDADTGLHEALSPVRIDASNHADTNLGYRILGRRFLEKGQLSEENVDHIRIDGGRMGIEGEASKAVPNQLGYDPVSEMSEQLIADFDFLVQSLSLDISRLFRNEGNGGEQGRWQAFRDGVEVDSGLFQAEKGSHMTSVEIDIVGGFDRLEISATPYGDGQGGNLRDASDFFVDSLDFVRLSDPEDPAEGGDDVLFGNRGDDQLFGGAGDDQLFGGRDNDHLDGGIGRDVLKGGQGDDVLIGGADGDSFVFTGRWGHDTVADFEDGVDILDFSATRASFDMLQISEEDGNTFIGYHGSLIALQDVSIGSLDSGDFLFA